MASDPSFSRVTILGVGLIGGSLGLALRRHLPAVEVVGYDDPEVLDLAMGRGAISTPAASLEGAVRGSGLVVLAAPLGASLSLLESLASHLQDGAVVTDVGSVKGPIARHASDVLPSAVTFVGGHPMTGSEKRGITHADGLLFENAVYVLCPGAERSKGFDRLAALLQRIGCRVLVMDAEDHDQAAARVSHIPQLLAVALVNRLAGADDASALAAGGFRDMTRIASSSFTMWQDILVGNQGAILDELGGIAAAIQKLRNRLAAGDMDAMAEEFRSAAAIRNAIPSNSKGFLNPLCDVFVYTPDEPGALLGIVSALSAVNADIKDIELLKIREGTGGTFRLGFKDARSATTAVETLTARGLQAYRL